MTFRAMAGARSSDPTVDFARRSRDIGGLAMARRMTAIAFGVVAVASVAIILSRRFPHPANDPGPTSVALITAFVAFVALAVVVVRRWRGRRTDAVRVALACVAGLVALFAILPYGCDDIGGVPDWERCWSFLGNPTLEWRGGSSEPWKSLYSILAPVLLSTAVGVLAWRVVGPRPVDQGLRPPSVGGTN
jgi:hypothetical protein